MCVLRAIGFNHGFDTVVRSLGSSIGASRTNPQSTGCIET